jgi:mono/diheme cytochrome c family protein
MKHIFHAVNLPVAYFCKTASLFIVILSLTGLSVISCKTSKSAVLTPTVKAATPEHAGKYLVIIGSCNDCHTVGYEESHGKTPESDWLTGSPVGFRGPWGTSYPSNLRLLVAETSEADFLDICKMRTLNPPMPWPALNQMSDDDLRAIYGYIKSLGAKGQKAPDFVLPGEEPGTPYILFEPQHMERLAAIPTMTQ